MCTRPFFFFKYRNHLTLTHYHLTFNITLTSSLEQLSSRVTRCSSHCWTMALCSALFPSSSGLLASWTRWDAIVTRPINAGPLLFWRTGTYNWTNKQMLKNYSKKSGFIHQITAVWQSSSQGVDTGGEKKKVIWILILNKTYSKRFLTLSVRVLLCV